MAVQVTEDTLCLTCGHPKACHKMSPDPRTRRPGMRCASCEPIEALSKTKAGDITESQIDRLEKFANHDFRPMLPFQ